MALRKISDCNIAGRRVLVRADLNVPLADGVPRDEYRLRALIPTLQHLQQQQASRIIIATHIGNPAPGSTDPAYSTQNLMPWFQAQGFGDVQMLENVRLSAGEKKGDIAFARQLAELADVYVNDAFGALHRADTSLTLLPQQFAPADRCIGLCVQREMQELDALKTSAQQPFVLVMGGAKAKDKIPLLQHFFQQPPANRPQVCIVGGMLAQACLGLGTALDTATIRSAQQLGTTAQKNNVRLVLPVDFAVIDGPVGSPAKIVPVAKIQPLQQCVDIGPDSIQLFIESLEGVKTVFTNGTMGMYEQEDYAQGTKALLGAIAAISGHTVVGGGDTVAAVHHFALEDRISFISTGGGATLAYLGSADPLHDLPGLRALLD